jgi:quercetin dioxygenase-like cupin family protein
MTIAKAIIRDLLVIAATASIGATLANAQTVIQHPAPPAANATPHQWTAPASGPTHTSTVLLKSDIPGMPGKELQITRTVYPPGAVNTKHYHTSQAVFYIIEGSAVFQEQGHPPVTLKAGDVLHVKPGTTHGHWNASTTVPYVSHEVTILERGQPSTIKTP